MKTVYSLYFRNKQKRSNVTMDESSVEKETNFSSSIISSVAEESSISAPMNDEFSEGEETIYKNQSVMKCLKLTSTSTPAKRKRKAFEHESPNYTMGEEPWLTHNASKEEQGETSQLGDREDDDDESINNGKNGDKYEDDILTHCNF